MLQCISKFFDCFNFDNSAFPILSRHCVLHRFAQGLRIRQIDMMQDGIAKSSRTLSKMARIMRKVCHCAIKRFRRRHGQMIGSAQEFAVLDESNFRHKRKVN